MCSRYIKKQYGEYKTPTCPFCGKIATQKNEQGLEVCRLHTKTAMPEFKCLCGSWIEIRAGKYGPYFHCLKCGNINYKKGLEIKSISKDIFPIATSSMQPKESKNESFKKPFNPYAQYKNKESERSASGKKEITITTDDLEYFS